MKDRGKNRTSTNRQNLEEGMALHKRNPLFSGLGGYIRICGRELMGKKATAYVRSDGYILLNQDILRTPLQWAYVIAHCQLHLAFGHFDGERMPGFWKEAQNGERKWAVSCNKYLWNMACDLYIARFLGDLKFGAPLNPVSLSDFPGATEERRLYEYLSGQGSPESFGEYGTGGPGEMDMRGLEEPLFYDGKKNQKNPYVQKFAFALANSVSSVVSAAGGHDWGGERSVTASRKAAQWFINHYPLLGGLAASFQIIEDYNYCITNEISIAAVDVTCGEIYVNPAAGLKDGELKFVLAHEFLHAGLRHHWRCQGRDPYLWNIACDYVINGWLVEMGIGSMPEKGLLYDESLKNRSAEDLYDQMVMDLRRYSKLDTLRGYGKGDIMGGGSPGFGNRGAASLDDFYRDALRNGLEYHTQEGRGYLPAGLVEEIRALAVPPIPWDVELARWFDCCFAPMEKRRSYARPSRRQGSTPEIPRPSYVNGDAMEKGRTFGVVVDTSGSMGSRLLGLALGAIASYAAAKEVPFARVVFCDACAYDAGYLAPEDIAGRVRVQGRGGTVLQPGVDLLERAEDFPKDGPILIITDGEIESRMEIRRRHAFLVPRGKRLPFRPRGEVFYMER